MIQLIPFNTSKGGNAPLECLENVSLGFSIGAKYPDAWTAWEHTEQHFDPIPTGLDVPLYYSYTTTIDGITKNYGHINVRLKNGTVWSDGNIYASVQAYEANHFPKYVGWGESVNNVKIIGVDDMKFSKQDWLVGAEASSFVFGDNFNFDQPATPDQFVQILLGQAPKITKEMESSLADSITGIPNVIGDGYNSQFVGKTVGIAYPDMVAFWQSQPKAGVQVLKPGKYQVN